MFKTTQDNNLTYEVNQLLDWAYGIASSRDGFNFLSLEMKKALMVYLLTTQELLPNNSLSYKEDVEEAIRFIDSEWLTYIGEEPYDTNEVGVITIRDCIKVNPSAYPSNFILTVQDEWELEDVHTELERTSYGWSIFPLEVKKALMITALLEKSKWCNPNQERQKELMMFLLDKDIVVDIAPFKGEFHE